MLPLYRNNTIGTIFSQDTIKKHKISISKNASRLTAIQDHSMSLSISYCPGSQNVPVCIVTFNDEASAPVSHRKFYKNMKNDDLIIMHATFNGVFNKYMQGTQLRLMEAHGLTTSSVSYVLPMEAIEETKKGRITVDIVEENNVLRMPTGTPDASKKEEMKGALLMAKVHFHYEIEGKKDMEHRVAREQPLFRRMLEKQMGAKGKSLRKEMGILTGGNKAGDFEASSVAGSYFDCEYHHSDDDDESDEEADDLEEDSDSDAEDIEDSEAGSSVGTEPDRESVQAPIPGSTPKVTPVTVPVKALDAPAKKWFFHP
ncbi:hypothetical protein BJ508DRAFT_331855 [Ascobolus immersus RN42]|uniref:Uncharacterized protein n=1 Tax=Ascobolus immersus RN42 TaxID=1160509 RepID=A0A3N4HP84_ASCIM|nr:hypothetical protein BJ508DRAFT_331855 [Ascobolus immersus RN42]